MICKEKRCKITPPDSARLKKLPRLYLRPPLHQTSILLNHQPPNFFVLLEFSHSKHLLFKNKNCQNDTPPNAPRTPPQNPRATLPNLRPQPTNHAPPRTRRLGAALQASTPLNILHSLPPVPFLIHLRLRQSHERDNPLWDIIQSDIRSMPRVQRAVRGRGHACANAHQSLGLLSAVLSYWVRYTA